MGMKKILISISGICLCIFLVGCTKYDEPAPFFDGLFLEYMVIENRTIYKFEGLGNREFKITEISKSKALGDDVEELFVDIYGKVYESSFKDYEGGFSPIWIPTIQMEIGDRFNKGYTVLRKDRWKQWDVLVIKNPLFDEEKYFDINSGYWVGAVGKGSVARYSAVLIDTNANVLTVEE